MPSQKILSFKEAPNKFLYEFATQKLAKEMAEIYSDAVQERCDRLRLYHDGNFLILDSNAMIEFLKQTNQESQIESMKNVLTELALELKKEIDSSQSTQSTPRFKSRKTATNSTTSTARAARATKAAMATKTTKTVKTVKTTENSLSTVDNVDNENDECDRLMSADEAKLNLTLALLYLSRISNNPDASHYWDMTSYRANDSFEADVIDWLEEVGFIIPNNNPAHGEYGVIISV